MCIVPFKDGTPLADLDAPLLSKLCWRIIPLLWLGFAFNVINRSNIAFAQLEMGPELGLSQSDFGFAAGIFFCSYALMQLPSNMLVARVGARWVLSADLLLWGVISTATGFVRDAHSLSTLRFLLGLAQAGYFSGSLLFLRSWFPARYSAHAVAIFMTSGAAGTIVCSLSSGAIMSAADGLFGLGGWRWLFIVQGLPPIILSVLLPFLLPARPQHAAWLTRDEREQLLLAFEVGGEDEKLAVDLTSSLGTTLSRPETWLFLLQYFTLNTATYTVMLFLPTQVRPPPSSPSQTIILHHDPHPNIPCFSIIPPLSHHPIASAPSHRLRILTLPSLPMQLSQVFPALASWQIGLLNASPALLKILLAPRVAALADRHDGSRFAIAWGLFLTCGTMLLAAGGCMLTAPPPLVWLIPLALLAATLAEGCSVAVFWSIHHTRQPQSLAACSIALVNSFGNLGGFAGTYVLGYLHDALGASEGPSSSSTSPRSAAQGAGNVRDWGWGTVVIGLAFVCVTCATGASLQERRPGCASGYRRF